ncbi:hypothetical protein AYI87_10545 [Shewanella sp. KCT]|nr:hypothetical protein AYI87_10545 [Shewanella sp. KCT]
MRKVVRVVLEKGAGWVRRLSVRHILSQNLSLKPQWQSRFSLDVKRGVKSRVKSAAKISLKSLAQSEIGQRRVSVLA